MKLLARRADRKAAVLPLLIAPAMAICLLAALPRFASADEDAEFRRAGAAVASGNLLEAQSLLEDFIESHRGGRNVLKARYLLGQILYRRADHAGAVATFSEIIDEHPEWEHADMAAYGLAMAQCGMLDYYGAARTLEALPDSYPQSEILADALYWLGESLYRRGDYTGALARFNQFLDEYPGHGLRENASDSAAWCLEQLGRYADAIEARQRFLKEFPNSLLRGSAEFLLAADYLDTGDKQAAIRYYLLARAGNTPSPLGEKTLLRAGLLLAEQGRPQESIPVLENLLAKRPQQETARTARLILGSCYLRAGDYKNAESVFQTLLEEPRDRAERCSVSFQLALAQVGLGKLAGAAARLSTIIPEGRCEPLDKSSALLLTACLLNLDQPSVATETLRSFLDARATSERSPDLLFALAGSLILAQQFGEARLVLAQISADERALDRWPQITYYEGLCLFQESQYARASEKFDRFIRAGKPEILLPLAGYMRGNSLLRAGKWAEATSSHEAFLKKWPDDAMAISALYQSGLANLSLGRYGDASSFLEEVIRRYPTATPARYFLGLSQMKTGDLAGAAEQFRLLLYNNPGFKLADRAAFAYGWAEFERGNYAGAGELFGGLSSKFPHSRLADSAQFFAAAAHYKQGFLRVAGPEFEQFSRLFPENPLTAEAMIWAGVCEEKLNHPENALALYREALGSGRGPRVRADTLYGIAWAELSLANQDAAAEAFGRMLEESPQSPVAEEALFWQGRLDYASGRWESAARNLLELSQTYPTSALADAALFFAARAACKSSDYPKAIELFELLGQRFPQSPLVEQARIEAAECMIEAGRADEAAREFERFIESNVESPLRPLVLYDRGKALQRAGRFEEAIEQYRAAAGGETTELAARSRFAIAECLAELDRSGEAMAELIGIARGGFPAGWAERVQLQVARLLEREGQTAEARLMYSTVADTYSDDAAGMVALRAIKRLEAEKRKVAAP